VYRIAQESIINAKRHAKHASQVLVVVRALARTLILTVTDDGHPNPPKQRQGLGFGLVGMAERAALLRGTFEAGPLPARGWRVEATFPLERADG
jgi:signal transduction histidine kinase